MAQHPKRIKTIETASHLVIWFDDGMIQAMGLASRAVECISQEQAEALTRNPNPNDVKVTVLR